MRRKWWVFGFALCLALLLPITARAYTINWEYPDPMELWDLCTTVDAVGSVYKPDDVPDYPEWVDWDGNPYVPGEVPTKDVTYRPVFTITWDNPTEPDVVDKVPYKEPVIKPVDDDLEGTLENQPWVNEFGNTYSLHIAYMDETYVPCFTINWNYPDPTDSSDTYRSDTVPADEHVFMPDDVPYDYPEWVNKDDPTEYFVPDQLPTKNVTYIPLFTITWVDPNVGNKVDKVPYGQPVTAPSSDRLWVTGDDYDLRSYSPHSAYMDETYVPCFTITWNYPEGTTIDIVPYGEPVYMPDDVPYYYSAWVNKDDPTEYFVPHQLSTKSVTYVPLFNITWVDPNVGNKVDKVPYGQPVTAPSSDMLWVDRYNGQSYSPHSAYMDESYVPCFTITWEYPGGTKEKVVPYGQFVDMPYDVPDYPEWVDQDGNPYSPHIAYRNETYAARQNAADIVSFVVNADSPNTVTCTVQTSEASTAFFALYDAENRFLGVELRSLDADAETTLTFSYSSGAKTAKLMLTDASGAPLCTGAEAVLPASASGGSEE